MIFLFPLSLLGVLGAFFIHFFCRNKKPDFYPIFISALALPVGFSICSFIMFTIYLIHPGQAPLLSIFIPFGLIVALGAALLRNPSRQPHSLSSAFHSFFTKLKIFSFLEKGLFVLSVFIWLFILIQFVKLFESSAFSNPFGGWDARFFWNLKAKFFFRAPELWQNMFSGDISWSHPDYPLLLPAVVAWGWNMMGHEAVIWPIVVGFAFVFSLMLFILWYLCACVHSVSGFLGSAFFMTCGAYLFWSVQQYADVPLSFYITAAGGVFIYALRFSNAPLLFLSGWLAGCSAWTKNEGIFFIGWLVLAFGIHWLKNRSFRDRGVLKLFYGLSLPCTAVLILKTALAPHGDYLGANRPVSSILEALFLSPEKTKAIALGFGNYLTHHAHWNGLWLFFATSLGFFLILKICKKTTHGGFLALLSFLILAGYFAVLHTSPHEINWQLETALTRLLLHGGGLALLFTFETCGNCLNELRSRRKPQAASPKS